jgi:hypothetical protein
MGVMVVALALGVTGSALAGTFDPAPGDVVIGDPAHFDGGNLGFADSAIFCGSHHEVAGGGASLGGAPGSKFITETLPRDVIPDVGGDADDEPDDSWDSGGYGEEPERLTAYGICAPNGALRYEGEDVPDSPDGLRFARVGCGAGGYRAVGGGGIIAPSQSWIGSSYPFDDHDANNRPDDGWAVSAFDTVGGPGGFFIDAVCVHGFGIDYQKARDQNVPGQSAGSATARCQAGSHVVGGGLRVDGPVSRGRSTGSYPIDGNDSNPVPDDGWKASFYNLMGGPKDLVVYATCAG